MLGSLSSCTSGLLGVIRVGVCLAHYDIRTLWHAESIWVVNDHMDRAYPYTAAGGTRTRWNASAIAGLLVEVDRADPGNQDGRVGRRIVVYRHASD